MCVTRAEVFVLISIAYWVPWGPGNMSMLCLDLNSHKHLWFSTLKKIEKTKIWEKKIQNPWSTFELLVKIFWRYIHYSLRVQIGEIWISFGWILQVLFRSTGLEFVWNFCSLWFSMTLSQFFFCFPTKMFTCFFFSDPFLDYLVTCWFKWPRFVEEKPFGLIMGYRLILEKNSDCFPFTPWSPFHSFSWH